MWPFTPTKTQKLLIQIMAKLSELEAIVAPIAETLAAVGPQLEKAKAEIIAALGGEAEIPAAALEKLNALSTMATAIKTAAQSLDDLNPDAPTP